MKHLLVFLLVLPCFAATAFAEDLADYRETIDQLSSWTKEKGLIKYKGANQTLKAFANAQNAAIQKAEKENANIKKAEFTEEAETAGQGELVDKISELIDGLTYGESE